LPGNKFTPFSFSLRSRAARPDATGWILGRRRKNKVPSSSLLDIPFDFQFCLYVRAAAVGGVVSKQYIFWNDEGEV
jgi:hypothetical protein